jgi:SAM-dependent methyltransferase
MQLLLWRPATREERALRDAVARIAPAYTMVDAARLRRLANLAAAIHTDGVAGCVVECGTWKGGSLALLDWVLRRRGDPRVLWAFDSFEGLPEPGVRDPSSARRGFFPGWCAAREDDVRAALGTLGSTSELHVVRGWLDDTLPRAQTGGIALLNVDVDWYDSVRTVLESLYDRVVPGGVINFDDYGRWSGCNEAVDEFIERRQLPRALLQIERQGAWFRKP